MLGTSWKTSVMGWLMIIGDVIAFISKTLQDQSLPTTTFEWIAFGMALVTGIGMILAKDRDVTGLPKAVPVVLLSIMAMGLTACATDLDLGGGRVMTLKKVEARSAFGVNDSRSRLADCARDTDKNNYASDVYTDCKWMESEWRQSSSPGQGGMIVSGALQGVGLGVAGALIGGAGNATANATAGAMQSQTVVPRGHH